MKDLEDEIRDGQFEITPTPAEIEMFERLAGMENIHNEIGSLLGSYRDSIMEQRNRFMVGLHKKYRIRNPHHMTWDPIQKKIVSIFNPDLKARKIDVSPLVFRRVASESFMGMIRSMSEILGVTRKEPTNG